MSRRTWFLAALCLLGAAPLLHAQGGKLQQLRDEVRDPSPGDSSAGCPGDDDTEGWGDLFGEVFGPFILFGLTGPFTLPHAILGDDFDFVGSFARHPYAGGYPGYMAIDRTGTGEGPPAGFRPWSGRVFVEESNDFDGLNRVNAQLLLETDSRFGFQGGWSYLSERLWCGCYDDAFLGDANVVFRFAQSECAQFRAGLGVRVLSDRYDTDVGFNFTYGADFYPGKPFIVSGQLDAGTLGSAGVVRVRGTAGVIRSKFEVFVGYDYLRIGSVDLQGPVIGLRLWF